MNYKKQIEDVLELLKKKGIGRAQIEKDFDYGENYIDQMLSKGGNKKALAALKIYCKAVLQNAIQPENKGNKNSNEDFGLKDVITSLGTISQMLDKVLGHQTLTRAEIRAYGQYQVARDARGDQTKIVKILAEIGMLVAEHEAEISKGGSFADNDSEDMEIP